MQVYFFLQVLGANIVRSGSKTFAVYSISVTDANNNSWSVKRRYLPCHFKTLLFSLDNLMAPWSLFFFNLWYV